MDGKGEYTLSRKSIAIDMDEVLADTLKKILQTSNDLFDLSLTEDDVKGSSIWEILTEDQLKKLGKAINEPGYFRDLEVIDSAVEVVKELSESFDIYIATAAMGVPNSFIDKYDWLQEHFPFLDPQYFIFCGDKKVVHADYLIDDNVNQLNSFTGKGILFQTVQNAHLKTEHTLANGWKGVLAIFSNEGVLEG